MAEPSIRQCKIIVYGIDVSICGWELKHFMLYKNARLWIGCRLGALYIHGGNSLAKRVMPS